jgi:hypothetical protein
MSKQVAFVFSLIWLFQNSKIDKEITDSRIADNNI